MALDAYSPCPCGSGKKFKWCCQPIYTDIDRALRQHHEGQHETALRIMADVVAANPGNPEAHGRQAQLLYVNGKLDEAENALQKAFEINPHYPFGHFLRGLFRQNEGEAVGALLLFRKAAELYDPQALDMLSQVYLVIFQNELKLNRPVAARAALQLALHYQPSDQALRQDFETVFGEASRQPISGRREYRFEVLPPTAPPARRQAWNRALSGEKPPSKFSDAARAFEQLTNEDPSDQLAWYNFALALAWLGDNQRALGALDRYVELEDDEAKAVAAWALAAVLRCGDGLEDQADFLQQTFHCQIREPQAFGALLNAWDREKRLFGVQVNEQTGGMTCCVLEPAAALTSQGTALQPKLGAFLMVVQGLLQLWHTSAKALDRIVQEVQQKIGMALVETQRERLPVMFRDVIAEALAFPVGINDREAFERRILEGQQNFFEDVWIHRPLPSLRNIPPIDAAGQKTLRKKVLGAIQFLQECAALGGSAYDFDRLRRKLGLLESKATADDSPAGPDFGALNTAELAAVATDGLDGDQLERAFQAALKLDAREVAGRFARLLVERPARADHPDRFPWFAHLVKLALEDGDATAALNVVNEGESDDCTHNEGRRRNDYELRRGQILTKQGDTAAACEVFDRLIARAPDELRFRGGAAEAMLSAKQGAHALKFAEQGLAAARQQNNRDSEGYFQELAAAARRAAGA